jgi:hypothetical protein
VKLQSSEAHVPLQRFEGIGNVIVAKPTRRLVGQAFAQARRAKHPPRRLGETEERNRRCALR